MINDELYDLLIQAFRAGQQSLLDTYLPVEQRHMAALNYADRVMSDLKRKDHVDAD